MGRLSYEQLNAIKEKFNVEQLWSYSKVSTYINCAWEYKLRYIDKIRVKSDNCYTWWGTVSHDLIQGLYDGEHSYEEMAGLLEEKILEYNLIDDPSLKFPNEDQFNSYIENLRHYFSKVNQLQYKVVNEKAILAVFEGLEKYVFQGYVDSIYRDEDDNLIILDYKTSSISGFSGKGLIEKSKQLMIYAMGMSQFHKVPLNKIKLRYDMMKYCNVSFMQKNGNMKTTKAERRIWVAKISNQLRKDLEGVSKEIENLEKEITKLTKKMNMKKTTPEEAEGYSVAISEVESNILELKKYEFDSIQLNEMIDEAMTNNNLDNMPQFIQDKYTVTDCHIDVELNDDIIKEFEKELVATLDEIVTKSKEEDLNKAFARGRIEEKDSFYCNNLCNMKEFCDYYKDYKEHNAMFLNKQQEESMNDDDLLKMLGL